MQYPLRRSVKPVVAPETDSMPLSKAAPRELLHLRDIRVWGYRRADGLYDIEGHLTDTKPYAIDSDRGPLPPGTPLHRMWMRLTIDDNMTIVASEACTEFGPFATCEGGAASYAGLVGLTIKTGFLRAANERLGGPAGCTWPVRARRNADRGAGRGGNNDGGTIALVNTCYAYASDGPVVQARWPHLYSGATVTGDGGDFA